MTIERTDIFEPWEEVEGDIDQVDLKPATGNELVMQRILRGYFTEPGTLHHRPQWGAGLQTYRGEPPTLSNRQRIVNDAMRFLGGLPFVDDASVRVSVDGGNVFRIATTVRVNGRELDLAEVTIA